MYKRQQVRGGHGKDDGLGAVERLHELGRGDDVAGQLVAAQVLKAVLDLSVLVKERVDVLAPVSYTHLDVYKRQVLRLGAEPWLPW